MGLNMLQHIQLLRNEIMRMRADIAYGARDDGAESEIRGRIDANVEAFVRRLRGRHGKDAVKDNILVQILLDPYRKIEARTRASASDFEDDDSILAFVQSGFGLARPEDSTP